MSETSKATRARRRLDLGSAANGEERKRKRRVVENPYEKAAKSTATDAVGTAGEGEDAAAASTVTPEAGIEKFFAPKREAGGGRKPPAARKLVTPHEDDARKDGRAPENARGNKRKSLDFNSEDDDADGLYYHSDGDSRSKNATKKKKQYEPGHIHSTLAYYHRGELPLDQGALRAYRFVRNHYLIPRDLEADPKFGPHSGSSFEERVLRAYNLGQLEPKGSERTGEQLSVCSYCGEEGHKRDACSELI